MNYLGVFIVAASCYPFFSCGGDDQDMTDETNSIVAKELNRNDMIREVILDGGIDFDRDSCEKDSTSDWTNFLGIPYGVSEIHLDTILKNKTGGKYSDDTTNFVWFYKGVERVPLTIWTNTRTTQVETIFIEVTSSVQYFKADIDSARVEYGLPECDTKWLGMKPKEVTELMGIPDQEESLKDTEALEVKSLVYNFYNEEKGQLQSVVNFRFYESQDYLCSMIIVSWFY